MLHLRSVYFANSPVLPLAFRLREIEHQRVQTGMSFDDPDQEGTGPNGDSSDEGYEDKKWISPEQVTSETKFYLLTARWHLELKTKFSANSSRFSISSKNKTNHILLFFQFSEI